MKMMTKEIINKIPKLYETDGQPEDKKIAHVKFFCPWNHWTWYAFEFDGKDTFFGFVKGHDSELGYFSLSELESITGPFGLKIERDMYSSPLTLTEIREVA